jgi:hypothetical protein
VKPGPVACADRPPGRRVRAPSAGCADRWAPAVDRSAEPASVGSASARTAHHAVEPAAVGCAGRRASAARQRAGPSSTGCEVSPAEPGSIRRGGWATPPADVTDQSVRVSQVAGRSGLAVPESTCRHRRDRWACPVPCGDRPAAAARRPGHQATAGPAGCDQRAGGDDRPRSAARWPARDASWAAASAVVAGRSGCAVGPCPACPPACARQAGAARPPGHRVTACPTACVPRAGAAQ